MKGCKERGAVVRSGSEGQKWPEPTRKEALVMDTWETLSEAHSPFLPVG